MIAEADTCTHPVSTDVHCHWCCLASWLEEQDAIFDLLEEIRWATSFAGES